MILLIDIGNSRTKYVQCLAEKSSDITQLSDIGQLSDIAQVSNQDFNKAYFGQHFAKASRVIVANVAKASLTNELSSWCAASNIDFEQVYSEQQRGGLISAYQEPSTLGIDRWLALLGAMHLYPNKHVLIIDAGTATTIDLVDNAGQHQGGWILAGIKALFNSILSNSTLVHAKSNEESSTGRNIEPSVAFGCSTTDNVNNACWSATLGMIKEGICQAEKIGKIDQILLTGGNGEALAKLLTDHLTERLTERPNNEHIAVQNIQFVENLIFYGLREYIPQ